VRAEVALAVEQDEHALRVFAQNIPTVDSRQVRVEALFDGELGAKLTLSERRLVKTVTDVDLLVGGPPCQGNSDLNNRTRRRDPRNRLYARMARAAKVLLPSAVLIENVPNVRHDRARVVAATRSTLEDAGYRCVERVLDAHLVGVPQRRRRHVLLAVRQEEADPGFLERLMGRCSHVRSVRWAIRDLERQRSDDVYDSPAGLSEDNRRRIKWLFEHGEYDLPNRTARHSGP